jgi:hypothetical protein
MCAESAAGEFGGGGGRGSGLSSAFVAKPSRWRLLLFLLGAAAFVAIGLWIAGMFGAPPEPDFSWFGWIAIAFFGSCGAAITLRLFDSGDEIRVDHQGFYWKRWSVTPIPWSAVQAVRSAEMSSQKFVCIDLVDPDRYPSDRMLGRLAGANKALGFGDIALSATGTDRTHSELLAAISGFRPPGSLG